MGMEWEILQEVNFTIPSIPPSVNTIYYVIFSQKRIEMKPEVRTWKTQAKEIIPLLKPHKDSCFFKLDLIFYYNFFFKNGKIRKFDSQNLIKILCDAIAEKNGFKDELIKFGSWESYHSENREYVDCSLKQIGGAL